MSAAAVEAREARTAQGLDRCGYVGEIANPAVRDAVRGKSYDSIWHRRILSLEPEHGDDMFESVWKRQEVK
jgi:hypothetical protein